VRFKICGIASESDVRSLVGVPLDFAGFLVGLDYPSEDSVSAERARDLAQGLPTGISPVLVTHRVSIAEVGRLNRVCGFPIVQLHGGFDPEKIPELRSALPSASIWTAVHVTDRSAIARAREVSRFADTVVLDTKTDTRLGGTGRTHDWEISARIVHECRRPVVLAGGITPENVARAADTVRPWAIDVNSGVENGSYRKDPERIRLLIERAR